MSLTHLVIHLEVQQVYGAPLAVEHVLGLGDDGGDEALQAHLLLEEAPRQSQQELEGGKELGDVFITKEAPSIITEKVAALLPTLNNEASYSVMGRERERVGEKVVSFVSGLLNFKWKVLREVAAGERKDETRVERREKVVRSRRQSVTVLFLPPATPPILFSHARRLWGASLPLFSSFFLLV